LLNAPDSEEPCSTSVRHCESVSPSSLFSVCSARIDIARRIGRPELIIVANCRENTERSLSLTLDFLMLISRLRPFFSLPTSSGV
jgi:hypothetical protein